MKTSKRHSLLFFAIWFAGLFFGVGFTANGQQLSAAVSDPFFEGPRAAYSLERSPEVRPAALSVPNPQPDASRAFAVREHSILDLHISSSREFAWTSEPTCELSITNRSSENAALIKYFAVMLNGIDVLKTDTHENASLKVYAKNLDDSFWLAAGETRTYPLTIKPEESSRVKRLAKTILTPNALAPTGDFKVKAQYELFTNDLQTSLGREELNQTVSSVTETPRLAIFVGCIAGVLLVTGFAFSRGTLKGVRKITYSALTGCFASIIAVLLLKYTQELRLPISIAVTDFYGGMIIGLLSRKLVVLIEPLVEPTNKEEELSLLAGSRDSQPPIQEPEPVRITKRNRPR